MAQSHEPLAHEFLSEISPFSRNYEHILQCQALCKRSSAQSSSNLKNVKVIKNAFLNGKHQIYTNIQIKICQCCTVVNSSKGELFSTQQD